MDMFQDDNALRFFNGLKSLGSFRIYRKRQKKLFILAKFGKKNPIWVNKALVK